jgi:hypothetical protein
MNRFRSLALACFAITVGFVCTPAIAAAAPILYDQSLGGAGFYNGSGNPDGGFTVTTENGVRIGMRAKHRQDPNVIHTPNDVYQVQPGPQSGSVTNRAWWNYEWDIDLSAAGLVLDDIFPYSTLTVENLTKGLANTVAFPYWADNATYGPTGELLNGPSGTQWGMQNSQNPVFGDFPLSFFYTGQPFNMNDEDYYRFTINVRNDQQQLLNSLKMDVQIGDGQPQPVPEPGTMLLLGSGLAAVISRKRFTKKRDS